MLEGQSVVIVNESESSHRCVCKGIFCVLGSILNSTRWEVKCRNVESRPQSCPIPFSVVAILPFRGLKAKEPVFLNVYSGTSQ